MSSRGFGGATALLRNRQWSDRFSAVCHASPRWFEVFCILVVFAVAAGAVRPHWSGYEFMTGDASMQIYLAQRIARGGAPYRDVIFPKTPLTGYVGALAVSLTGGSGLDDVIAVRRAFCLLTVLCAACLYVLARQMFDDAANAAVAAVAFCCSSITMQYASLGPEPKLLMLLCGLGALWAVQQRSWAIAGAASSLAFLAWQPGGVFSVFVFLAALRERRERRRLALVQTALGALVPICLVGVALLAGNALKQGFRQAVLVQLAYARGEGSGGALARMSQNLTRAIAMWRSTGGLLLDVGLVGWVVLTVRVLLGCVSSRCHPSSLAETGVAGTGLALALFAVFDFQHFPDLVPLVVYPALGLAWALSLVQSWSVHLRSRSLPVGTLISGIVVLLLVASASRASRLSQKAAERTGPRSLPGQLAAAAEVAMLRESARNVQALGDLSCLVLNQWVNATPVIHMGPKHHQLLLDHYGSMLAVRDAFVRTNPQIMLAARLEGRPWTSLVRQWLDENYVEHEPGHAASYSVYVRTKGE